MKTVNSGSNNTTKEVLNESAGTGSNQVEENEADLVRAARAGSADAFGKLVIKYQRRVYALTRRMTRDHALADDLAQEAFIKAWRNIGKYRGRAAFYTWLYRIAVNTSLTRLKQTRNLPRSGVEMLENIPPAALLPQLGKRTEDGADRLRREELAEALETALNELPDRHREVIEMHVMEGIPHREISRALRVSEGTVRSRLHYARRRLKKRIKRLLS